MNEIDNFILLYMFYADIIFGQQRDNIFFYDHPFQKKKSVKQLVKNPIKAQFTVLCMSIINNYLPIHFYTIGNSLSISVSNLLSSETACVNSFTGALGTRVMAVNSGLFELLP